MLKGIASLRRFFWAPVNRFWSGWMGEFSQFYAKLIGVNVGRWESARKVGLLIWVIVAPLWKRGRLYRILVVCHSVRSSARHNFFISALYLENSFIEFIQILYVHWYWHDLALDCYMSFLPSLYQSYGPWFMPKFRFRSISREQIDRILPNFIYASIFQDLAWDCYTLIFRTFVPELWSLIYAKILFSLNILRTLL